MLKETIQEEFCMNNVLDMNNELIKVEINDKMEQVVSARDLYNGLEIKRKFSLWVKSNFDNFIEGEDYEGVLLSTPYNKTHNNGKMQEIQDYVITVSMAKELAMMSKSKKGKQYRKYFIELERKWNDPQEVVKRGYEILRNENIKLKIENNNIKKEKLAIEQQYNEAKPKITYYDIILQNPSLVSITQIAKDYGMSGKAMNQKLKELKLQFKQGDTWFLYAKYQDKGWTSSETKVIPTQYGDKVKMYTKWTQKGRLALYDILKEKGILPMIERNNQD